MTISFRQMRWSRDEPAWQGWHQTHPPPAQKTQANRMVFARFLVQQGGRTSQPRFVSPGGKYESSKDKRYFTGVEFWPEIVAAEATVSVDLSLGSSRDEASPDNSRWRIITESATCTVGRNSQAEKQYQRKSYAPHWRQHEVMGLVDARAPAGAYTCITIIMEEPNRQNVYILCLYIDLQRNPSVPRSILSSMTSRMLTPVHGLLRFGLFAKSPSGDLHLVQLSGPQTLFTQLLAGEAKNDHDNFATLSSFQLLGICPVLPSSATELIFIGYSCSISALPEIKSRVSCIASGLNGRESRTCQNLDLATLGLASALPCHALQPGLNYLRVEVELPGRTYDQSFSYTIDVKGLFYKPHLKPLSSEPFLRANSFAPRRVIPHLTFKPAAEPAHHYALVFHVVYWNPEDPMNAFQEVSHYVDLSKGALVNLESRRAWQPWGVVPSGATGISLKSRSNPQITHKEHLEIFHNALQAELRVEVHNPNHFAPSISKVVIVDNKVPQGSRGQISEVTPPLPSTSNVVAKSFPLNSSLADDERNQSGLNQLDFSISSQVLQQDEQQQQKEPLLHVKLDLCPYPFHFSRTILFLSDSSPFR